MGSVIWRIVLALAAIVAIGYAEQFFPGVGLVVVCLLVPIGLLWEKFTHEFHERDGVLLFVLGICFVVLSIVNTQVIGVKVAADGRNGAKLVSSFYPFGRVLAEGDSIDTVNVAWRYKEDDGTYFAERRDCYIVHRGKMTQRARGHAKARPYIDADGARGDAHYTRLRCVFDTLPAVGMSQKNRHSDR
ncbi:MAG: hypothetical protein IJU62_02370 [Muribaculaceae bacterium]|nr:hypothetical protein [Muribaculaceae bacterium]